MKILVTGGAGYVGVPLVSALLDAGHQVTIVDNFMFGFESVLHLVSRPNLKMIKNDVRNEDLSYLDDSDVVFHLAAISGYPECEANPNSAQRINLDASIRISDHLSKDQLLVFASTTSIYGASGSVSDEETEVAPVSLYGMTKLQAERVIMQRENSISLRWATVFGVAPRMRSGLMVNDFVQKAIHEGTLVLYSGDSKRTFMHVNDSVAGYLFALEHVDQMRGGVFNMGSEELNYSKRDIAENIHRYESFEIVDSSMCDKDVRHFYVSYAKAKALGFECQYSLDDGIVELIKLYRFFNPHSFIKAI
ncbi:UDP-glucose 4-epimerase [Symmachiella dynata]|uniref:UDP-glucose 4-epimerase n=2 Tax=Symmachiella TaxID=2795780 RepID=A0A517ZHK2_9PLAN|nr:MULTISPECIES: NAD(P)-dependent oxidoreductase [Symmachiella]QDT46457.1 UDP-glucose 4-epimerase [Symmachiella dynata]QDU41958.1 UDP-glucose 4-epimerase [Symmachiella dynata]TWU12604.1 UDP-glucose 4-epimerase [Symmachiella macrocystis]